MKAVWQSLLSVVLGFVGGVVASNTNLHFKGGEAEVNAETVRAARFELVDSRNNPVAYWGKDKQGLHMEITFLDETGTARTRLGVEAKQVRVGQPTSYSRFGRVAWL